MEFLTLQKGGGKGEEGSSTYFSFRLFVNHYNKKERGRPL